VISGYSTDGRLKAYHLVVLKDDKGIFPPYYAAPIVRENSLKKFACLEKILNLLAVKINDSIMTSLNYKTDYLHQSPEKVAKDFLVSQKLWRPAQTGGNGEVRIGSKIFGEQYILANMYSMLIKGYSNYDVATKTGLGGTKICFDALMNDQIDFYPEYTGTGLLAILQPPARVIDSVTTSPDATYSYVKDEFEKKYNVKWLKPIGFNNAYALMMRKEQAENLKIKTISDLKRYLKSR
jgi:osmoprotectant transport system permease protein